MRPGGPYKLAPGVSITFVTLALCAQWSVFLCAYEQGKTNGYIPAEWPSYLMNNPQPQAITSFAISLLLVSLCPHTKAIGCYRGHVLQNTASFMLLAVTCL